MTKKAYQATKAKMARASAIMERIEKIGEYIEHCSVSPSMAKVGDAPVFVQLLMEQNGLSGDAAAKINAIAIGDYQNQKMALERELEKL